MRFSQKNVLITGAAAGVGRTMAQAFAAEGADIAILDWQDAEAAARDIGSLGRRCACFRSDIRDEAGVIKAVAGAADFFSGRIDVLINNAGFNGHYALIKDMPLEHWHETLAINLTGTMLVTREVVPLMIEHNAGVIGITASNVARRGLPYRADYVCSKWALLGFTQTLALEVAPYNIRVNAVCPGPIEGERIRDVMAHHAMVERKTIADVRREWEATPMKRFIEPREVAAAMLFLSSDEASAMTGQALNVTGGFIMT
ncbi:MAG TPA: SDR family NAD(P)-dependent oxidoreductase [Acetobacteraceae bacterium]|nr:SDR family NAD(P)-dependent oxidoreductase [Acetobacteraceae bacterium]